MRDFMIMLLECSATMSALALLYMLITPLLAKRYSVKWRYYIWLIIVIGLIIPFRPQFDNAIIKVNMPNGAAALAENLETGEGIFGNQIFADDFKNPVDFFNPIENYMFSEQNINLLENNNVPGETVINPAENIALSTILSNIISNISFWEITAVIWLFGMVLSLAYHTIKYLRFMQTARRWSVNIEDAQTLELFQSLKTEMNISDSKKILLRLCPSIGVPILIGMLKPQILLPKINFEKDELRFILKHELVHYKRKDLWYKFLLLIATSIHWFNPVVYLTAKAVDISCELSCDDEVIKDTDIDTRWNYGKTILDMAKYRAKLKTILSTHLNDGKKDMKKRLSSVMDSGRKKGGIIIACIIVIGVLGTGLLIAINTNKPLDDTPKQNIEKQTDEKGNTTPLNYLDQLPATDKLVLWRNVANKYILDSAIKIFNEIYPDIEIEIRDFEGRDGYDEYETLLQTELPLGKGPDLLLMSGTEFPDMYKTMDTDVFCDLNDFINNDFDFNLDNYNKAVLNVGVYKSKRYLMPIDYMPNIMVTTEEALAAAEINPEDIKSFEGLTGEIKKYLEKYNSTKLIYNIQMQGSYMLFPWCGLKIIDYENKTVNIDSEDFKKVMNVYKDIYKQNRESGQSNTGDRDYNAKALMANDILFISQISDITAFGYEYGALAAHGYSPIYFNFPGINGKSSSHPHIIAAITRNSQNKANAYAFLKILLSVEIQGGSIPRLNLTIAPVLNGAVDMQVQSEYVISFDGKLVDFPEKARQGYADIVTAVDDCKLLTGNALREIFFNYMLPYFKGEDSYENCLNKTRNFLELYVSE